MTGTIGRAGLPPGADDMMSEMAKRLAARRAKAEGLQSVSKDSGKLVTLIKLISLAEFCQTAKAMVNWLLEFRIRQ